HRSFDFAMVRDGEEVVVASRTGTTRLTIIDAARHALRARKGPREVSGRAEIRAAMPGRVVNVLVAPGDEVTANQGVIIVEAMKMENELRSPKAGRVVEVKVAAGQTGEKGEMVLGIEEASWRTTRTARTRPQATEWKSASWRPPSSAARNARNHFRRLPESRLIGSTIPPIPTDLSTTATSVSPATIPSPAAFSRPCIAGGCGPCASMRASGPQKNRTG